MNASEMWWRKIAEPLLEDEALRGDLDDAAFQVLLDWALTAARRCAAAATIAQDPVAHAEACARQLRLLLRSATRTAVDGQRRELLALIGPPAFAPAAAAAARERLATISLTGSSLDNAHRLAAALANPTEEATP